MKYFKILLRGKAKDIFPLIARAVIADRLLEAKFGKSVIVRTPNLN